MNRRGFLQTLAAGLAGAALDPERLLWTPGAKTHFLPPPKGWERTASGVMFRVGDIVTFEGVYAVDPLTSRSTVQLRRFVVTARSISEDWAPMAVSPRIVANGPYRNVSQVPQGPARGVLVGR
jgi:hypothetical protein